MHETAMQQADASTAEANSQLESLQAALQAAQQEGAQLPKSCRPCKSLLSSHRWGGSPLLRQEHCKEGGPCC